MTAILAIPVFLALIYHGGIFLQIGITILVLVGLYEFARMHPKPILWDYLILAGLSLLLMAYIEIPDSFLQVWFVLQLLYLLIRATFAAQRPLSQMWHMVAVFYVSGLFSFLWLLNTHYGFGWTLYSAVITWATDSGAYFSGYFFGKNKLAPNISPKKTWEGAIGGTICATIAGLIFARYLTVPLLPLVCMTVVLSVLGQIGDLVESAIKRERAVKDSGFILPGHGGILDRFDSLLFVVPSVYLVLKYILPAFS